MKTLNKENQKKMVTRILKELEPLLHKAIDENRTDGLNAFEMILVATDKLDKVYKNIKSTKSSEVKNNVVSFPRRS